MSIESKTPPAGKQRTHRLLVVSLAVIALLAIFYMGTEIREQKPNFYSPGRAALINARLRFEESMQHEEALIEQQRISQEGLNLAISLLSKAENLDPADRADIEDMQTRIKAIEKAGRPGDASLKLLQKEHRDLLEQMDALITKIETKGDSTN